MLPPTLYVMSTQDLQWLLVRKSNSYLVKQKGLGRVFSREPGNLAALHSYKYSGVVNDKSVGIAPAEKKGVNVVTKKTKASPLAVKGARAETTVKGGPRRVAGAVANIVAKNRYRPDLRKGTYHSQVSAHHARTPLMGNSNDGPGVFVMLQ